MEKAIEAGAPWSQPMPVFVASGSAKDAKFVAYFPSYETAMRKAGRAVAQAWSRLQKAINPSTSISGSPATNKGCASPYETSHKTHQKEGVSDWIDMLVDIQRLCSASP